MIVFRADANEYIASGHVMRCLSIADALFSLGEEVAFITSDENATEMIRNRGHKAICLNTDWNDKEGELDRIIPELDRTRKTGLYSCPDCGRMYCVEDDELISNAML